MSKTLDSVIYYIYTFFGITSCAIASIFLPTIFDAYNHTGYNQLSGTILFYAITLFSIFSYLPIAILVNLYCLKSIQASHQNRLIKVTLEIVTLTNQLITLFFISFPVCFVATFLNWIP